MDALSIEEKLIISEPVDSVLVSTIDAALMCKRQEKLVDMPNEQEAMLSMIETSLPVANVKKERYTCDSCGKIMKTKPGLLTHLRLHFMRTKTFRCMTCANSYHRRSELKRHMEMHNEKHLACTVCSELFKGPLRLQMHMRHHQMQNRLVCSVCGNRFARLQNLKAHELLHFGTETFECEQCDRSFVSRQRLRMHITRTHLGIQFECDICPRKYTTPWARDDHRRKHDTIDNRLECRRCGDMFPDQMALRTHEDNKHKGDPFKCTECSATYRTISRFKQHMESHTPVTADFTCDICEKHCRGKYSLLIHHRTTHKPRSVACPDCTSMFKSPNALRMHRMTHVADEPNHPCPHCDKAFKLPRGLISHLNNVHRTERKYLCLPCDKRFKTRGSLRQHSIMKSHAQMLFRHQLREAQKSGITSVTTTAAVLVDDDCDDQLIIDAPDGEEAKNDDNYGTVDDWLAGQRKRRRLMTPVVLLPKEEEKIVGDMVKAFGINIHHQLSLPVDCAI